jgi:hypothetical protein
VPAEVAEEAEQRGWPVDLTVAAEEGGVLEDAAPGRADGGGAARHADESGREAEDLVDGVVHQLRKRHVAGRTAWLGGDGEREESWMSTGRWTLLLVATVSVLACVGLSWNHYKKIRRDAVFAVKR